jgi:hypothetical protein
MLTRVGAVFTRLIRRVHQSQASEAQSCHPALPRITSGLPRCRHRVNMAALNKLAGHGSASLQQLSRHTSRATLQHSFRRAPATSFATRQSSRRHAVAATSSGCSTIHDRSTAVFIRRLWRSRLVPQEPEQTGYLRRIIASYAKLPGNSDYGGLWSDASLVSLSSALITALRNTWHYARLAALLSANPRGWVYLCGPHPQCMACTSALAFL